MKNKNHEVLIEQLKNDNNKYNEFKQYFYYHSRREVSQEYNLTQQGLQSVLNEFNLKVPKEIRNKKRKETCLEKYGCESVTQTEYFKEKSKQTSLAHFGYEHPNQNKNQINKIKQTKLKRYGNCNYNNMPKNLETRSNQSDEYKQSVIDKRKQTCIEKYGGNSPASSEEVRRKMENTTFIRYGKRHIPPKKFSKQANKLYNHLCKIFGEDDIITEYNDPRYSRQDGYQYNCDFYVISEDLFIELNHYMSHGSEPFDENNEQHLQLLERCKTNPRYKYESEMVKVWAGSDVEKRKIAEKNNLNYITIYPTDNIESIFVL